MVTAAQRKARATFARKAKSGELSKTVRFSKEKIKAAGGTVSQFIKNLKNQGYKVKKTVDGDVSAVLKGR